MRETIHFTKMHGAGNDYIYVNTLLYNIPDPEAASIKWSAYHKGIGSDGLVLIGKPEKYPEADFSMRIFNADGSEAMMCGNASRCIGKYLYEKGLTEKDEIKLETKSGVKILHLHISGGVVESVTVDMLEPRTDVEEQFTGQAPSMGQMNLPFEVLGQQFVSMGNPHYVIFVNDIEKVDVAGVGKVLEFDSVFPQRCNIEFAQVLPSGGIRTRVWERGSGITQACGTGACATETAAVLLGKAGRESDIIMDGGTLHIEYRESDNHIYMTGPAAFVFEGEIEL